MLKEKRFASSLMMKKNPLTRELKVTLPMWNLIILQRESPHGAPSPPFMLIKYQIEDPELIMKWLHPLKKKTSQSPTTMKMMMATIYPPLRLMLGKGLLLGKVKAPRESNDTPPAIKPARVIMMMNPWVMGRMTRKQLLRMNMAPSSTALAPIAILLLRQQTRRAKRTDPAMKQLPAMMRVS